eukprot:gnl/TRDRNA2_/TRDRNA2_93588_c0_seq1.p1 gnl/TRDRNA2_/TRDRNA2_93588_c0~~gnl/TRDRNA2_/TRDRNA2_93588_c0_seq1.p1  ORF type:complete len:336 (-),score=57.64 gnl/TRDRNA2_/TRDRNA2_93588_c0_seq1:121-1059(-)
MLAIEQVRGAALKALKEFEQRGSEATFQVVREVLKDPNASADIRVMAVDLLQALSVPGDVCSIRTALFALQVRDVSVRSTALKTLQQIGGARGKSRELLEEAAGLASNHEEQSVRVAAMELVGQLEQVGGSFGISAASTGLCDADADVRQASMGTLRQLLRKGDPDAVNLLCNLIDRESTDSALRTSALELLIHVARRGDPAATASAAVSLGDRDSGVQGAAAKVLKQLCVRGESDEAVRCLLPLLDQRREPRNEPEACRVAVEVIGYIASVDGRDGGAVVAALRCLVEESEGDISLRLAAESSLRQLGVRI